MSEVNKRDRRAAGIFKLFGLIKNDKSKIFLEKIDEWKRQLDELWVSYQSCHELVMERAGDKEVEEQESIFDKTSNVVYQVNMLLAQMRNELPTNQPDVHAIGNNNPQQLRFAALQRRLEVVHNRVNVAFENGEIHDCVRQIERNELQAAYAALQAMAIELLAAGADQQEVSVAEATATGFFQDSMVRLADREPVINNPENANLNANAPAIKLPQLHVSPFDGSFEKWEAFRETFTHAVHNRNDLPNVQKLQFLKGLVKGEAEELIQNFRLTNDNYVAAWELLTRRYNNNRELLKSHLRVIVSAPTCGENADDLRRLTNKIASSLLALRNLDRPVDEWDDWVVFHVLDKVGSETRRLWEQHQANTVELSTWGDLDTFLQGRIRALSCVEVEHPSNKNRPPPKNTKIRSHHVNTNRESKSSNQQSNPPQHICPHCGAQHLLTFCDEFRRLSPYERRQVTQAKGLCFVCLKVGHRAEVCTSNRLCHLCDQRHNSMLHIPANATSENEVRAYSSACIPVTASNRRQVLLATAVVCVRDYGGSVHKLKCLLDQGSEASFVSQETAQMLRLPRQTESVDIVGLSGTAAGRCKQSIRIEISDQHGKEFKLNVRALIVPKVTTQGARANVESTYNWPHLRDITLADPDFLQSQTIDILLGSDVYGQLLLPGLRKCSGYPTAQNTYLGWIVSGVINAAAANDHPTQQITIHHAKIDDQMERFWEMEETSMVRRLTVDEERCEVFFSNTFTRDETGRMHVRLPMKHQHVSFGDSQRSAVQRQLQIERRFNTNPELASKYREFMAAYLDLGHMKELVGATVNTPFNPAPPMQSPREYYIPHHAVLNKPKLRVVFDASRRTTNGLSLNEQLHIGPRLQDDLTAIIMRWRKYKIAYHADIAKMYRQIVVDEPDTDLQRIVWRPTTSEQMKVYQLTTVTYGTAAAPYLAIKSLQTLARLERLKYPVGADIVLNNFYVDDVLSGADTVHECIDAQKQLLALLKSGGLELRKWASNTQDILSQVNPEHCECNLPLNIDDASNVSTLGVQWNPASDEISIKIEIPVNVDPWTKRTFLSAASKLYDPLGWLAPCIVVVKILFQSLWKRQLEWDDVLPADLAHTWNDIHASLQQLQDVRISRWIGTITMSNVELHGFCDASMTAYAAVVYARVVTPGQQPRIHILSAKTKVAPIKVVSLPRLELCGAVLLVKLIANVIEAMQWPTSTVHCWTDSTIVLSWLRGHPSRFNVFVANRTSEIQRTLPCNHWRHVVSEDNPADCASRGMSPSNLLRHKLWWKGPQWLSNNAAAWPQQPSIADTDEETKVLVHIQTTSLDATSWIMLPSFSSWRNITRVTAWCVRFGHNCRVRKENRKLGPLVPAELLTARTALVRTAQEIAFPDELRKLRQNQVISKKSSLLSLNPFLSPEDNVLRVGGRLSNASEMTIASRFPAIIPRRSHLSSLLTRDAHEQTMHGGPSLMLAYLRRSFWVIDGANEVQRFVKRCTVCFRYSAIAGQQLMASLPAARVTPSRPFRHCAMDYSGAIMVRSSRGRGHHATKAYVAVFVCLATRAVHIELVGDLTTTGFIAAYERFVARRGCCTDLYSDNATNFVGAAAVFLRTERKLFDERVTTALATKGTTWHFTPPLSPHFNGMAESAIRSVKHHIRRVVGEATLTFEELVTVLIKIEACLNSRPLCAMNSDPSNFDVLTPAHFLIGEPINIIPQRSVLDSNPSALTRWQLTHQMVQRIWKRWSVDYLHTLQQRRKWQTSTDNLRVNDLVLIIEDNMPPARWALGRVIEVHPGDDGRVRVATVRTTNSTYKRPVVKLAKLPIDEDYSY